MKAGINTYFTIGSLKLSSQIVRSATYEGMADNYGLPSSTLVKLYTDLARNSVGAIITGFCFISKQGRAMQPRQCGIADYEHQKSWSVIVSKVKKGIPSVKLVMQIAHTGRQTLQSVTGEDVVGISKSKSTYFKQSVHLLNGNEIEQIISDFGDAAARAKRAGFDAVQIHGAHGYLIHQFLSPTINKRKDKWGKRSLFLTRIIANVRETCGNDFPIWLKLSHADDLGLTTEMSLETIKQIEHKIDAVEISYGTMDFAMNIFRGDCLLEQVLRENPLFKNIPEPFKKLWKLFFAKRFLNKFIPFTENYNVDAARYINSKTDVDIFPVGGIRNKETIKKLLKEFAAVGLCRALICEPDFVIKENANSKCTNCNYCAVSCDSERTLKCIRSEK